MFICRTRFSLFLPKSKAWIISREMDNVEEYKKVLFEEKRLNFRVNFLKNITLPILDKLNEEHKMLHVIDYSDSLPERYISKLKDLADSYSFIRLNVHDEQGHSSLDINKTSIEYFELHKFNKDMFIGNFVLDDDDCVSLDYFKIMTPYLEESFEGFYVSAGLGVVGLFDENYGIKHCAEMYWPKINIGFMNVGRYSFKDNELHFSKKSTAHSRMDKVNRVILDSRQIAYYWSRHPSQDTRLNKTDLTIEKLIKNLKSLPPLDIEQLSNYFGSDFYSNLTRFNEVGDFE